MSKTESFESEEIRPPKMATDEIDDEGSGNKEKKTSLDKDQQEAIIGFIETLIDILTLKRIALISVFGVIAMCMLSLYDHRADVMQSILGYVAQSSNSNEVIATSDWTLSEASKEALIKMTKNSPINYVSITEVDLKKNMRKVRFFHINSALPTGVNLDHLKSEAGLARAVFDYDAKNTEQMVAVLANEFRCDPYKNTHYAQAVPQGSQVINTICRLAIPPFIGQFVGYITVGISKQISKQELDSIRLEASRLAVEVYLNDVDSKVSQKP